MGLLYSIISIAYMIGVYLAGVIQRTARSPVKGYQMVSFTLGAVEILGVLGSFALFVYDIYHEKVLYEVPKNKQLLPKKE